MRPDFQLGERQVDPIFNIGRLLIIDKLLYFPYNKLIFCCNINYLYLLPKALK